MDGVKSALTPALRPCGPVPFAVTPRRLLAITKPTTASQSFLDSPLSLLNSSLSSSPLSSSITPSLFHSRLKTYLFNKSFPLLTFLLDSLDCLHDRGTAHQFIFFIFFLYFLFVPCSRLSWLSVSFLLHVICRVYFSTRSMHKK